MGNGQVVEEQGGSSINRSKYEEKRGKSIASRNSRPSAGYFVDLIPNLHNSPEDQLTFYVESYVGDLASNLQL
jgi:hypothetical protein